MPYSNTLSKRNLPFTVLFTTFFPVVQILLLRILRKLSKWLAVSRGFNSSVVDKALLKFDKISKSLAVTRGFNSSVVDKVLSKFRKLSKSIVVTRRFNSSVVDKSCQNFVNFQIACCYLRF